MDTLTSLLTKDQKIEVKRILKSLGKSPIINKWPFEIKNKAYIHTEKGCVGYYLLADEIIIALSNSKGPDLESDCIIINLTPKTMNTKQIKHAVDSGKIVHWRNTGYVVIKEDGNYLVRHLSGNTIGLTWSDGVTLNGKEEDFFIEDV